MKKDVKGRFRLDRETLASLEPDALDSIVGGNATVNTQSRWPGKCLHSMQYYACLGGG